MPLVSILLAVIAGKSIGAVVAMLSISDWISIATLLMKATPDILKALNDLHPAFEELAKRLDAGPIEAGAAAHATIHGPQYHGGPRGQ